jgi:hypothetical protein
MSTKMVSPGSEDTERAILHIAPEQESLDWICYRVRGGADPAGDAALESLAAQAAPAEAPRSRPEREDIERALGNLVRLGMLSYDGRRWTMTAKGYAAS